MSMVALSDSSVTRGVLGIDGVPRRNMDLDDRYILEVPDVGDADLDRYHLDCLLQDQPTHVLKDLAKMARESRRKGPINDAVVV